jgi:hypothetical protein
LRHGHASLSLDLLSYLCVHDAQHLALRQTFEKVCEKGILAQTSACDLPAQFIDELRANLS